METCCFNLYSVSYFETDKLLILVIVLNAEEAVLEKLESIMKIVPAGRLQEIPTNVQKQGKKFSLMTKLIF